MKADPKKKTTQRKKSLVIKINKRNLLKDDDVDVELDPLTITIDKRRLLDYTS